MSESKVSIIIPVYNTSNYLDKCISSILEQSYKNLEIIFIDDGSIDNSLYILRKYEKLDKRIKILEQENQGQGVARNYGLKEATGEYICFVDSDDRIDKLMVEKLLQNIKKEGSDFSSCLIAFEDKKGIKRYRKQFDVESLEGDDQIKDSYLVKNILPVVWNKIYRKDFLTKNKIIFPNIRKNEDMLFIQNVILNSQKCSFISEVLYYTYRRESSTSRKVELENITNAITLLELNKENLKQSKKYQKFYFEYGSFYIRAVFNIYIQGLYYKSKDIDKIEKIILNSKFSSYIKEKECMNLLVFKYRIAIILYKFKILKIILKIGKIFGVRIN